MTLGGFLSSLTMPEIDELKEACHFTDDEAEIFELLSIGYTVQSISCKTAMSERTVSRRMCSIKNKIKRVRCKNGL